ncbi:hypothetical protein LJB88_03400 [Erysipelotrichaceae bacterium OttesenSCG-928-M19]|nr:hypothetical protein [Erysipelotrichaceae bacterium OttesenSCG-928-M19]
MDLVSYRELCHECASLVQYQRKQIKLGKLIIIIYYFKYYENICLFNNNYNSEAINNYLHQKYFKNKGYYSINELANNEGSYVFYRREFDNLITALHNIKTRRTRKKLKIYEFIDFRDS